MPYARKIQVELDVGNVRVSPIFFCRRAGIYPCCWPVLCTCVTCDRVARFGALTRSSNRPNLYWYLTHHISTMSNAELEKRCDALRRDLKIWEKQFAVEHQGRKAERQDIKADATICTLKSMNLQAIYTYNLSFEV